MSQRFNTAEVLGRLHKELLDQGFDAEQAFVLTRDSLPTVIHDGIGVSELKSAEASA